MVRHSPRKMCAAPGAYMPLCQKVNLPSSVARRPLCHKVNLPRYEARRPLCHKVNIPIYEARRRHLIMTCDIYGTEINKLNVGYGFLVSKETVVLRPRGRSKQKFGFIKRVDALRCLVTFCLTLAN